LPLDFPPQDGWRALARGRSGWSTVPSLRGHECWGALDEYGMPPPTGPSPSPLHLGLWFFGPDGSIYGNMHIHRRQARRLAQLTAR
jgi:hypothetical protein